MNKREKAMIDDLAKKAIASVVEDIPDDGAPFEAAYRLPTLRRAKGPADPFAFVACALALILVIPPAIGGNRTTVADLATTACAAGVFDGSAEFTAMAISRGRERLAGQSERKR